MSLFLQKIFVFVSKLFKLTCVLCNAISNQLTCVWNKVGYSFDYVPTNFVKDLLVHDAHHHPYLERLAQLYLMKLRCKNFGSDAGAAWRQLAVVAFFPWLAKYRVFNEERLQKAFKALKERREQGDRQDTGFDPADEAIITAAVGKLAAAREEARGKILDDTAAGFRNAVTAAGVDLTAEKLKPDMLLGKAPERKDENMYE